MTIEETLNYLLKQIETISTVAVSAVKSNIFKVTVGNFPKTQDVKGTVIVGNQKNVEGKLKEVDSTLKDIRKAVIEYKAPDSIKVLNFPIPEKVVIPEYPKEIKVSNPQKIVEVTNLEKVTKELQKLGKQIEKIDISPKVTVEAPQVNVEAQKAPIINIPEGDKLLSDDPKKYIPVRLTDGEKFYEAITNLIGGLKRVRQVEVTNGNILSTFETNDIDKASSTLTYNGMEEKDGNWCIQKIDSSSGVVIRFATSINNKNIIGYTGAWINRLTLSYGYFSEAF